MASAWKPAKACHDFNNDFTLFTAVPVLFNMYTDKDSNLISLHVLSRVLCIISLYGALSLHNPAHLQVLFSLHLG